MLYFITSPSGNCQRKYVGTAVLIRKIIFYQYRDHLSGIIYGGGDQCGECADNGNPGDSGDRDAVWAEYL